jgi:hypothetical protein
MQKNLLLLFVFAFFFSCKESESPKTCGVENPVEDIAWIKEGIKENEATNLVQYSYLVQATYKGKTVFFFGSCCPFCKFVIVILDCEGKAIPGPISISDLIDQKVIWKPANSVCNLD